MVAIKEEAIKLGEELGQGEFGSVLKGVYKDPTGKKVRKGGREGGGEARRSEGGREGEK